MGSRSGKRLDNRNQKYFPTNWSWSAHMLISASLQVFALRNHADVGERTT